MTPPDWASQKVDKVKVRDGETDVSFMARLLRLEHARAVRVVQKMRDETWYKTDYLHEAYKEGRLNALDELLAALQRGRTQKGTR